MADVDTDEEDDTATTGMYVNWLSLLVLQIPGYMCVYISYIQSSYIIFNLVTGVSICLQ